MTSEAMSSVVNQANKEATPRRLADIRVLVLFGGSHLYGQERANLEVFRSLSTLGLKAHFLTSWRFGAEQIEPELDRFGFEWTRARFGYHWGRYMLGCRFYYVLINLFCLISTSWTVWREVKRWRPTHMYAPNWMYFLYAWPALALSRLPLVYRAGDELPGHTRLHRWLTRGLVRRSKTLVCNCQFLARKCQAAGLPAEKCRVIYNHPPDRKAAKPLAPPGVASGATVITYVGQIAGHKGVGLLVEAVVELLREKRNVVLWILGQATWGGPLEEQLRQKVAQAGLEERIRFFGFVEDVPAFLNAPHLHVCPSIWPEPSPNVVMEAKQAGLPSVVFPVGGIPELVEHQMDGYVCAAATTEELIRGLRWFLDEPIRMAEAGRRARASLDMKFGHERFVHQWAEVFLSTMKR